MTAITMRKSVFVPIVAGLMVLILVISGMVLHRAEAATYVPQGAEVTSATLYVYITSIEPATDDEVFVHEVTSSWDELTTTWATQPSYNPTAEDSFQTGTTAGVWRSVDVTDVVQSWVDGGDNYGLLMREVCPDTVRDTTLYASSEYATEALRPYLMIDFASIPDVTIQRSGSAHEDVFDTYVWSRMPTTNYGNEASLYTGTIPGGAPYEPGCKFSLIQFDIEGVPGTGTPGYWKNHRDAWPITSLDICFGGSGSPMDRDDVIDQMNEPVKGDKRVSLFFQLAAAILNRADGNPDCEVDGKTIDEIIDAATLWLCTHGTKVKASDDDWQNEGAGYHSALGDYNEGNLCAPHRD